MGFLNKKIARYEKENIVSTSGSCSQPRLDSSCHETAGCVFLHVSV